MVYPKIYVAKVHVLQYFTENNDNDILPGVRVRADGACFSNCCILSQHFCTACTTATLNSKETLNKHMSENDTITKVKWVSYDVIKNDELTMELYWGQRVI